MIQKIKTLFILCALFFNNTLVIAESASNNTSASLENSTSEAKKLSGIKNDNMLNSVTMLVIGTLASRMATTYRPITTDVTVAAVGGLAYFVGELTTTSQYAQVSKDLAIELKKDEAGNPDAAQLDALKKLRKSYEDVRKTTLKKKNLQMAASAAFTGAAALAVMASMSEESMVLACRSALVSANASLQACAATITPTTPEPGTSCAACVSVVTKYQGFYEKYLIEKKIPKQSIEAMGETKPKEAKLQVGGSCVGAAAGMINSAIQGACANQIRFAQTQEVAGSTEELEAEPASQPAVEAGAEQAQSNGLATRSMDPTDVAGESTTKTLTSSPSDVTRIEAENIGKMTGTTNMETLEGMKVPPSVDANSGTATRSLATEASTSSVTSAPTEASTIRTFSADTTSLPQVEKVQFSQQVGSSGLSSADALPEVGRINVLPGGEELGTVTKANLGVVSNVDVSTVTPLDPSALSVPTVPTVPSAGVSPTGLYKMGDGVYMIDGGSSGQFKLFMDEKSLMEMYKVTPSQVPPLPKPGGFISPKKSSNPFEFLKKPADNFINFFISPTHAGSMALTLGSMAASYFLLKGTMATAFDLQMFVPMRRAVVWGVLAGLSLAATKSSQSIIEQTDSNIQKIDKVINDIQINSTSGTTGGGTNTVNTSSKVTDSSSTKSNVKAVASGSTTSDEALVLQQKTPCLVSSCTDISPVVKNSGDFKMLNPDYKEFVTQTMALGNSLGGKSTIGAGTLKSAQELGNRANAISRSLATLQDEYNKGLSKSNQAAINFAKNQDDLLKTFNGHSQKEISRNGMSAGNYLAAISPGSRLFNAGGVTSSNAALGTASGEVGAVGTHMNNPNLDSLSGGTGLNQVSTGLSGLSMKLDQEDPNRSPAESTSQKLGDFELGNNDIHINKESSIFDIISSRYQKVSEAQRLQEIP